MITFKRQSTTNKQKLFKLVFYTFNTIIMCIIVFLLFKQYTDIKHNVKHYFSDSIKKQTLNKYNIEQINKDEFNKTKEEKIIIYKTMLQNEWQKDKNFEFKPYK